MPAAPSKSKRPSGGTRVDLTQEEEDATLGAIMNSSKAKFPEPARLPPQQPEAADGGWEEAQDEEEEEDVGDEEGFADPFSQNVDESMTANAEKMKAKKLDLLNKLYSLSQDTGVIIPGHINIRTPLDEIEAEHSKIVYDIGKRKSIRMQRRMLMGLFSTIEMANEMSGGPDELEGVSRTLFSSINDFDGPFTENYERYGTKIKVHPMVQIAFLAGSTVAYHCYAKSMAKHQAEQEKEKAQTEGANDPLAAQRHMRDVELKYQAEERARDARVAQAQLEAKRQNDAAAAQRQRQLENMMTSGPASGNVVTPSAYGLQQRPSAQVVPPPLSEPAPRPAAGEYLMRGPMSGGLVGTTTTPAPVGLLSEIAPVGGVSTSLATAMPLPSAPVHEFQALPETRTQPPTPSGRKPASGRGKKGGKKKDDDDVAFT